MGKLDGKVAFISGAARGQGRSHAVRLAQEGADIIGIDILAQLESVVYPMSTQDDLDQTVKEVEALGPADIVLANAGIGPSGLASEQTQWDKVIGVNLTGVWNTGRVAIPSMVKRNQGGAIVIPSSTGGLFGVGVPFAGVLGYTAAKHGVIGLMRSWANYLAPYYIRCNTVAPTRSGRRWPTTAMSPTSSRWCPNSPDR